MSEVQRQRKIKFATKEAFTPAVQNGNKMHTFWRYVRGTRPLPRTLLAMLYKNLHISTAYGFITIFNLLVE
jgi:hypothetical protein